MVKLRLTRVGTTKQPSYRLVAANSRAPRDGRFIEILGHYNPMVEPATLVMKEERILDWLKKGAQPTEALKRLLVRDGLWKKHSGKDFKYPEPAKKAEPAPEAEEAAAEAPAEEAEAEAPAEEATEE